MRGADVREAGLNGPGLRGRGGKGRVLVIEDDRDISLGIRTVLARNGFDVASSADGKEGLRAFHVARPDLVVLDIGLPTLDGWAVLERIRDLSDVPVLILTAHGNEADKVRGLHGGADDYLTKPFGNRELAARVEALLRRPRTGHQQVEVYDDGLLQVKFSSREVSVGGTPVALTPTEYRLLSALVRHPSHTLTPEQLLKLAWNDPLGVGPERVKFGIMRLRRKLGQDAEGAGPGSSIQAVRGFGYRYVAPSAGG
jgi:DNA-binding response OmpR family regulator